MRIPSTTVGKGVVGVLGIETGVVTAGMAAWTVTDLISTAADLAKLAGTKGQAALNAIMDIKDIKEKSLSILEDFKKNPHKAHANAMSIMAQLDPCVRARKCMLVPYQNTKGLGDKLTKEISGEEGGGLKAIAQARHGNGCCPGQTGHHILPDAMVKDAGCPGYDYDMAPTVCLEGTKNGKEHGSHGMAHGNLSSSIAKYKTTGKQTLSYAEAKNYGLDAIERAGVGHCDRACLEAQLDQHYAGCKGKDLDAVAGMGGGNSDSQATTQRGGKK